eukprot:TRINITY_DN1377_c0_g1_i4.p1 TRINITY_DN1377_c0_g1~~TRINITY_DN1377_c0_g1_i4.p1  ORF type:complete len:147 (+),score=39.01 TRINITY_DN1377_c0_g1_i4:474-914(+)
MYMNYQELLEFLSKPQDLDAYLDLSSRDQNGRQKNTPETNPKTELTNTKQGIKVFIKKPQLTNLSEVEIEEDQTSGEDKPGCEVGLMKNPIYWFGYLPPPSLQLAQKDYRQGLETAILMVNHKRKIEVLCKRISVLLQKKKGFIDL